MNFIDIFIAATFLVFGWIGFRRGILRTVISVIGLLVGGGLAVVTLPKLFLIKQLKVHLIAR
jgi:uncharacterized membrane protein required for colicin V production